MGLPVLVFPSETDRGSTLSAIPDNDLHILFKYYLAVVPRLLSWSNKWWNSPLSLTIAFFRSEQVSGFALVIDRRSDDWNSVRTVFQKVVSLFPARIREVYLLHHRRHHQHHHQPQLPNKDLIAHQLTHEFLLDFDIYVLDDQSELQHHINTKYLPVNLGGEATGTVNPIPKCFTLEISVLYIL